MGDGHGHWVSTALLLAFPFSLSTVFYQVWKWRWPCMAIGVSTVLGHLPYPHVLERLIWRGLF